MSKRGRRMFTTAQQLEGDTDGGEMHLWPKKIIPEVRFPVLVLPLDHIERLTERVADAICRKRSLYPLAYCRAHFHLDYEKAMFMAEAVLSALGAKGGR